MQLSTLLSSHSRSSRMCPIVTVSSMSMRHPRRSRSIVHLLIRKLPMGTIKQLYSYRMMAIPVATGFRSGSIGTRSGRTSSSRQRRTCDFTRSSLRTFPRFTASGRGDSGLHQYRKEPRPDQEPTLLRSRTGQCIDIRSTDCGGKGFRRGTMKNTSRSLTGLVTLRKYGSGIATSDLLRRTKSGSVG